MRPVRELVEYLAEHGMPRSLSAIKREHVEAYLVALREREGIHNGQPTGKKLGPAYLLRHYKGLKSSSIGRSRRES
jgi:hypothetical protein